MSLNRTLRGANFSALTSDTGTTKKKKTTVLAPVVVQQPEIPQLYTDAQKRTMSNLTGNLVPTTPMVSQAELKAKTSSTIPTLPSLKTGVVQIPTVGNNIFSNVANNATPSGIAKQVQADKTFNLNRQAENNVFDASDNSPILYSGNGYNITQNKLDKWLADDYKLSSDEKKQARAYLTSQIPSTLSKNIIGWVNPESRNEDWRDTTELQILAQKSSNLANFLTGAFNSIPGIEKGFDAYSDAVDALMGSDTSDLRDRATEAAKDSGLAYEAGKMAGKVGQYAALNASGVLAPLQKAFSFMATPLGAKASTAVGNILADQVADTLLDVIPRVAEEYEEGMTSDEIIKRVIDLEGENAIYNLLGEFAPKIIKGTVNQVKKAEGEQAAQIAKQILNDNPEALNQTLNNLVGYYKNNGTTIKAVAKQADDIADAVKSAEDAKFAPNLPETEKIAKETINLPSESENVLKGQNESRLSFEEAMANYDKEWAPIVSPEQNVPEIPKISKTYEDEWGPIVLPTDEAVPVVKSQDDEILEAMAKNEAAMKAEASGVMPARTYTSAEINDIQSYKNYRDSLLSMAQKNPDPGIFDTINRMDDEMWQKYPELFDEGNFKGVPTVSTPSKEIVDELFGAEKDMSFRNVKIADTAKNKNINDIANMYSPDNATRQDVAKLKSLVNEYVETKDDATYEQITDLTKRIEERLKGATYQTHKKASGIAGERAGYTTIPYPDAKRGSLSDTISVIIDPIKQSADNLKLTVTGAEDLSKRITETLAASGNEQAVKDFAAFKAAANDYSESLLKNGATDETIDYFDTMLAKANDYAKSSGDVQAAMKNVNDILDEQTGYVKETYRKMNEPVVRSYEDEWGPVTLWDEPKPVDVPVAKELDAAVKPPKQGQVSQFWEGGTTQTVTDPKTYDDAYAPKANDNRVTVKTDDWVQNVSDSRLHTNGTIDPAKIEVWRGNLSNAEALAKEDMATAFDIKNYLESNGRTEEAVEFWSSIRPHITNDAQVMQYLGTLKKNSIEGSIEQALGKIREASDAKKVKGGYTDAINNLARQVENSINSGNTQNVADLFKKKLSDFAYGEKNKIRLRKTDFDGEQQVLDLIGGWMPDKMSPAELAEEAGSLVRKLNGVADITTKDEAQVLKLLTEASQYEKGSREFKELQAQAAKIFADKIPTTLGDKIKTTLYDNMLGNFKTAVTRNAGGNLLSNALEKLQKPLKVGIDKLTSFKTGERNYLLDPDVAKAYKEGFQKGLKEQTLDIKTGINTTRSGEETFADALANVKTVYKGTNKVSKVLGAYDKAVKTAMLYGDRPFYEAEYAAAKVELNKIVDKFGTDALTQVGVPKEALGDVDKTIDFLAHSRALEACFQKGTITADGFTKLKNALGDVSRGFLGADVVSQFSMPFIQVPANIMERFSDYLPVVGEIKNLLQTVGENATGNFNQRRFVDALSRNLTGLGLFGGGVALANNAADGGWGITGGYSDDRDQAAAQKAAGELEYALKLPWGTQMDISDVPVLGPMIQSASRFAEATRNGEDGLVEGGKAAISSALETSALQGLNRMLGTSQYGGGSMGENIGNTIIAGAGQVVPSLVRQTAQVIDPYKRDLGDYGTLDYFGKSLVNLTPFRMLLDKKIDSEGNAIEQNQGRNVLSKALENYLLPWTISNPEYSDLAEEAGEIFDESSDNTAKAYPTVPTRSDARNWLGDDYSEKDYYNIKEAVGNLNSELGEAVIDAPFYQKLNADEKATVLSELYSAIKATVREDNEEGYSSTNKIAKAYKEGDVDGVVDFLAKKYALKEQNIGVGDTSKIAKYVTENGGGLDEINEWYEALGNEAIDQDKYDDMQKRWASEDFKAAYDEAHPGIDRNMVTSSSAVQYLRGNNITDASQIGETIYNAKQTHSKSEDGVYSLGGYKALGQYYSMMADARALNPDSQTSASSVDKKEMTAYLTSLGYDLSGINQWFAALDKNPITEKQYNQYLEAVKPPTLNTQNGGNAIGSDFESWLLNGSFGSSSNTDDFGSWLLGQGNSTPTQDTEDFATWLMNQK